MTKINVKCVAAGSSLAEDGKTKIYRADFVVADPTNAAFVVSRAQGNLSLNNLLAPCETGETYTLDVNLVKTK